MDAIQACLAEVLYIFFDAGSTEEKVAPSVAFCKDPKLAVTLVG